MSDKVEISRETLETLNSLRQIHVRVGSARLANDDHDDRIMAAFDEIRAAVNPLRKYRIGDLVRKDGIVYRYTGYINGKPWRRIDKYPMYPTDWRATADLADAEDLGNLLDLTADGKVLIGISKDVAQWYTTRSATLCHQAQQIADECRRLKQEGII